MALPRLQAFLVVAVCLVSIPAAAAAAEPTDEPTDDSTSGEPPPAPPPAAPPPAEPPPPAQPPANATTEVKPAAEPSGWHTEVTGYFRAPMALGISSRPGPDNMTGPSSTQVSYGPNRTVDSNYYSFAYTRLQEQDWAEVFVHAKKKHVDAAVGWMGYWFQSVGFRNYDAAWAPGLAYVALDTDFNVTPELAPNVAFTMGAWWPSFGYFEKYDTYTLGRFRQLGAQLKFKIPMDRDLTANIVYGFGTNRDGSFNPNAPAFYGAIVGLDLLTYFNAEVTFRKNASLTFHYNTEWTADPNLFQQSTPDPKSYMAAQLAHLTVVGGEMHLRAPYLGHLWISPSYINVRNGWALASAGTEVMHSLGGAGIATNYMAWTNSPSDSTGTGTMFNLGFLYENSLSGVEGKAPGSMLPDVTVSVFGLLADASLNLPSTTTLHQNDDGLLASDKIDQLKLGADATLQALSWLGFTLRYDVVNYNLDHPGYIFESFTGRAIFSSNFLSSERIYIQYSRYRYGDKMVLNGTWPWGAPLVAGANVLQEGPYSGMTPDKNVLKLQAEIAF
jgi:hypothetical protein